MNDAAPNPVGLQDAVEKTAPYITCTDHIIVEIEETEENAIRLSTLANLFDVPVDTVAQAVIEHIESEIIKPAPDQELTDFLIHEQQKGFSETGD